MMYIVRFKSIFAIVIFSLLQMGVLSGKPPNPQSSNTNLTFEEAVDSINTYLKSDRDLSRYVGNILKSKKYSESVPVFEHILLEAKRPHNRVEAAKSLIFIWTHTKDSRIPSILRQVLEDTAEVVQIEVLKGLSLMGEDVPLDIIERLAKGEGKENWIVDWGGPLDPHEYMTDEQIKANRKMFRDRIQFYAINILVGIKKEDSRNILEEIKAETKSRKIKSQVKAILERFEGKEGVKVNREVPVSYVSDKMEEITEYRRAHLKEYLAAIDSFMDSCRFVVGMENLMNYVIDANELSALSKLEECLLKSRCSYFRALAADAIGWIEKAHNDRRAVPALRKALDDPVTEVKFAAAKALWRLGEDGKAFDVLAEIAKGVGKENWTADWYGYTSIVNPESIEKLKRVLFQEKAIMILGKMKTKESISVLQEIAQHNKEKWARDLASNILKNLKKEGDKK